MRTRSLLFLAIAAATLLTNVLRAGNIAHGVEVVVIDAGHGGKFPGAHYGGVYEKDLTLKVALKLGRLIEEGMPGVKVVYTRKTDKALGATLADDLQARADIANGAGGDLFWGASAFARAPGPFRPPAAGSGPAKQRGARLSAFRRRRLARPCAGQSAPRARARRRYSPESSPAGRLYRPRLNSVFGSPCTSVFCCSRQVNEARNPISRNSASASGQVLP